MSDQADKLTSLLERFGLSRDEAHVYLHLAQFGENTALSISKALHMGRTKVYRVLDKLMLRGLVEQRFGARGAVFFVTDPARFEELIVEKKAELSSLEQIQPLLTEQIMSLRKADTSSGSVTYHKGADGLKQITWNSLKAHKELLIYEMVTDMSEFLSPEFSEEVRRELVKRRIHVRQITNYKHIPPHTSVHELVESYWEVRYLSPKLLPLTYEMLVYNDTVAIYNSKRKEIFGLEVQDKDFASMQKQLFEFVWKSAVPMKKIGNRGEVVIAD